jgi:hypothetical protein
VNRYLERVKAKAQPELLNVVRWRGLGQRRVSAFAIAPGVALRGRDRRSLVPERLIEIRLVDSPCSQHLLRRRCLQVL